MCQKKIVYKKVYLPILVNFFTKLVVLTEGSSGLKAARPIPFRELMNRKVDLGPVIPSMC